MTYREIGIAILRIRSLAMGHRSHDANPTAEQALHSAMLLDNLSDAAKFAYRLAEDEGLPAAIYIEEGHP